MRFFLFIFAFTLIACNASSPKVSNDETPEVELVPQDPNRTPGMELSDANTEKGQLRTFPNCYTHRVIVYELDGREGGRAESAFHQRTGKAKELNVDEITPFLEIINDKKSFGNFTAACHDPRIGIVFYDNEDNPCSYLSLCMACNNLYSKPVLNIGLEPGQDSGFSKETRDKLRGLFANWGFPDENISEMFDK